MPPEASPKRAEAKKIFLERAQAGLPHTQSDIAKITKTSVRTIQYWSKEDNWQEAKRAQGLDTLVEAAGRIAEDPSQGLNFLVGSFGYLLQGFFERVKSKSVEIKDLGEFFRVEKAFVDLLKTMNEASSPDAGGRGAVGGSDAVGAITNNTQINVLLGNMSADGRKSLSAGLENLHRMLDAAERGGAAPPGENDGGDGGSSVH